MRWSVVLMLLLAGCSSTVPEAPAEEPDTPPVVTRPDDYGYNTTQAHFHDYWQGKQEVRVFEAQRGLGSIAHTSEADFPVRGGTDQVVPQGTRWVNITVAWDLSEPRVHGDVELWLRTASSAEPFLLAEVASGDTVSFESSNAHNDLPHQRLSAWEVILRFHEGTGGWVVLQGGLEVTVTAARGLEIPLYPGHPDRWRGASEIDLLDYEGTLGATTAPFSPGPGINFGFACIGHCLALHRPDDGAIVPHDAAWVEVVVTETTSGGAANVPGLVYHAADSLEWSAAQPADERVGERTYRLPVEGGGDGPYAMRSLWEFLLVVDGDDPKRAFVGSYTIEAKVLRYD